jgi:hypothetical protein
VLSDQIDSIVAVTGLAGHPLHSWQRKPEENWLRDYLPDDFKNCKVWTYGYDTDLDNPHAMAGTLQLAKSLADTLDACRQENNVRVLLVSWV